MLRWRQIADVSALLGMPIYTALPTLLFLALRSPQRFTWSFLNVRIF